jgi:hypothetical protein
MQYAPITGPLPEVAAAPALTEANTVELARQSHRLLLGLQWHDALTLRPLAGPWTCALEAIGARPWAQTLIPHGHGRHALLHRERVARLLAAGVAQAAATPPAASADDPTLLQLRGFGPQRRHVPRRLGWVPRLVAGLPPADPRNTAAPWVWPGSEAAWPAGSTVLRGRVRRGPELATAEPVAWARVILTRPPAGAPAAPNFATEPAIGWAHGDDRGEFVAVLASAALPGGADLPARLRLHLWAALPAAPALPPDPAGDPLAQLPLEIVDPATSPAEQAAVLQGRALPSGYALQAARLVEPEPGRTTVLADAELLFP